MWIVTALALDHRRTWTIRRPLAIGLAALFGFFAFVIAWAVSFTISGAVIGKGQVQVTATRIAVQHPVGGVIAQILASGGDKVHDGDVVLRLDDSSLRAELAAIEGELFELLANEARLEAEIADQRTLPLHPLLLDAAARDPGVNALVAQQQSQLTAHYRSLWTQVSLLEQQRGQISAEGAGVFAALAAKQDELKLLTEELNRALQNMQNGFVTRTVVSNLQRDVIKTKGEVGSLIAKRAELSGKVAEQRLKTYATPLESKEVSADRLNLLRQQSTKLIEARSAILYKLDKLQVRAPVSGSVFDSKMLGPRSVIEAAKPIMYIVPDAKPRLVVVRVEATDIEQVHVGQPAGLRFTTFGKRSTPVIQGFVSAVSADAFLDEKTKSSYYFVDVQMIESELAKLGSVTLLPGMPVDAFLKTEDRSPASYVIAPIANFFQRAFRD